MAPVSAASAGSSSGTTKATFAEIKAKALDRNTEWTKEDFPELVDVVYWCRQVLGVLIGLVLGVVPLTGMVGLATFGILNAGLMLLYYTKFLQVDVESYGGATQLLQEGFMPSFGLFVLTWTMVYTLVYYPSIGAY